MNLRVLVNYCVRKLLETFNVLSLVLCSLNSPFDFGFFKLLPVQFFFSLSLSKKIELSISVINASFFFLAFFPPLLPLMGAFQDNLFEWHFTVRGPPDSDFDGGIYHGRIVLPPEYPMKPPSIILLTVSRHAYQFFLFMLPILSWVERERFLAFNMKLFL